MGGHQLLLFTCHEHIKDAFEQLKVEVRRLPTRVKPTVVEQPKAAPTFVELPVVEVAATAEEELGLADEPEREPVTARAMARVFDDGELQLSDEALPTRAQFLDDITLPEPEPVRERMDYTVAEAPEEQQTIPLLPPRREKKPRSKPQPPATPSGFEELRYDEPGTDAKPHRFTWESPERWWREPGETDVA
jgi:hypothetical protein